MTDPKYSTSEYRGHHGKKPRGRGTWRFRISGPDGDKVFRFGEHYTYASKLAKQTAVTIGATSIMLMK